MAAKIDLQDIRTKLPVGTTPEDVQKRKDLFKSFDQTNNGYLSLAEIDKGILYTLDCHALFNAKRAIMRAFQAAKDMVPADPTGPGQDYVQLKEFRYLLMFLVAYFELWIMFDEIDTEDDRRIDAAEFTAALPRLEELGISAEQADFDTIDKNHGGEVLFSEFCSWAIKKKVQVGDDEEGVLATLDMTPEERIKNHFQKWDKSGDGSISKEELVIMFNKLNPEMTEKGIEQMLKSADLNADGKVDYSEFVKWIFKEGGGSTQKAPIPSTAAMTGTVDWEAMRDKLPFEKTPAARERRKQMFKEFDPSGNGYLSLAEVDKGITDVLNMQQLFNAKPVIMRAFQAAKSSGKGRKKHGADYVELNEFRILLQYLRDYFELWVMFDIIDSGDDRRVNLDEFKSAVPKLAEWGVTIEEEKAEDAFKSIDTDGGGKVLFDEFCEWAIKQKLDLTDDDD